MKIVFAHSKEGGVKACYYGATVPLSSLSKFERLQHGWIKEGGPLSALLLSSF